MLFPSSKAAFNKLLAFVFALLTISSYFISASLVALLTISFAFCLASEIIAKTGINPDTRVRDLSEDEVAKIRELLDADYKVEGDLRREEALNIKRLIEINSYRGKRHRMGLPLRGQRTKTNARTRKGPRKAIAGKKK